MTEQRELFDVRMDLYCRPEQVKQFTIELSQALHAHKWSTYWNKSPATLGDIVVFRKP